MSTTTKLDEDEIQKKIQEQGALYSDVINLGREIRNNMRQLQNLLSVRDPQNPKNTITQINPQTGKKFTDEERVKIRDLMFAKAAELKTRVVKLRKTPTN